MTGLNLTEVLIWQDDAPLLLEKGHQDHNWIFVPRLAGDILPIHAEHILGAEVGDILDLLTALEVISSL